MSATKNTIGVITALGGTALIGYFLIKKEKPIVSQSQLEKLKQQLEEKSAPVSIPKIVSEAPSRVLLNYYPDTLGGQTQRVDEEYPVFKTSDGDYNVNDCKVLDIMLRDIILKISAEGINYFQGKTGKNYFEALQKKKAVLQNLFSSNGCAVKIENERLDETGLLTTKSAIETEISLLKNTTVDQNIYLATGGLLLLGGLFIILKK